jgi:flagellum-specific peptidoglycan hydrolase FlgJ
MNKQTLILGFTIIVLLSSCKSKKNALEAEKNNQHFDAKEHAELAKIKRETVLENLSDDNQEEIITSVEVFEPKAIAQPLTITEVYIDRFKATAMTEMRSYKIPASITLAQGILESGSGQGNLTSRSNNHFGIKCHSSWEGQSVRHDDDKKGECFRKYKDPSQSFRDHSLFLYGRKRYAALFELKQTNYKGWAKGLNKAGYATDPTYPKKLISIIEKYQLQQYDYNVLGREFKAAPIAKKRILNKNSYRVVKGDTLYEISKRNNISVRELKKLNNLNSNHLDIGQVLRIWR